MKNKKIAIGLFAVAACVTALAAVAQEGRPVVLTPTKLYDMIEELRKDRAADVIVFSAEDDSLGKSLARTQARVEALEKKMSHVVRILKLQQGK